MGRAFGIPATNDDERARRVAAAVEGLGYTSIWTNDTSAANGLITAAHLIEATEHLRVGIGVVSAMRRSADEVVQAVEQLELPFDRVVIGIGSGPAPEPIRKVRETVGELRQNLGPQARIAVAAMGPQMCRLAGEVADTVLLNWMLPSRVAWARERIAEGAARVERPEMPEVACYVRAAVGEGARERIAAEAAWYNRYPAYTANFQAMGAGLAAVGVSDEEGRYAADLADYDRVLDEVVVRALPASDSTTSTLAVAEASVRG